MTQRRFDFEYQGDALTAQLTYGHGGALQLAVGDAGRRAQLPGQPADSGTVVDLQYNGQRQTVQCWQLGESVHLFCDAARP